MKKNLEKAIKVDYYFTFHHIYFYYGYFLGKRIIRQINRGYCRKTTYNDEKLDVAEVIVPFHLIFYGLLSQVFYRLRIMV